MTIVYNIYMKLKFKGLFSEMFILLIITVPAFLTLLNSQYFSMHDDQHIARLYLLFEGIKQGQLFPRWVDMLGFGYGYPLFNFYPPLIYYIAAGFHFFGFSLIWSIKLMIITGFITAAIGIYLLIRQIIGRLPALLGATIYTYFFYHAVTAYVRGALAEFFSMAILPFVFLGIYKIYLSCHCEADVTSAEAIPLKIEDRFVTAFLAMTKSTKSALFFSISFALLILTHPLIAFPSLIFIGIFFSFLFLFSINKIKFIGLLVIGLLVGLGLSSFYWLPSMMERKFTLTDNILTQELANYKDHYVDPTQLWYSPWGFGGSVKGMGDGFTFQLGKIPILLVTISLLLFIFLITMSLRAPTKEGRGNLLMRLLRLPPWRDPRNDKLAIYLIFLFLFLFSLFMTTSYSSLIWDNIKYLWYMQFPWRMLTFTALFISICCSYAFYYIKQLFFNNKKLLVISYWLLGLLIIFIIFKYSPYFKPQNLIRTTDKERITFEEIAWRISSTSYEFVPKGVVTKKTMLGTTTLAIEKDQLPKLPYQIFKGIGKVDIIKNLFAEKIFLISNQTPLVFQLNTYNFPGWIALIDGIPTGISDNNNLKLITLTIPSGKHTLQVIFTDTLIRKIGDGISLITLIGIMLVMARFSLLSSFHDQNHKHYNNTV
jgi:hypothetical protein